MEENVLGKEYQEVSARVLRAKTYVQPWKDNMERWRRLYNSKHYKLASNLEPQYNDPTHTNTVDLAVGIMLKNKARWHAYGFNPSRKEQTDTGKIEKLIEGIWDINDVREEKSNMYELFLNYTRDGGGVIYSVFDPIIAAECLDTVEDVDPNSPTGVAQKAIFSEPPVRIQIIDPAKVFALPGGPKRWLMIGRTEEMTVLDVETIYGVSVPKFIHLSDQDKSTEKAEFADVWDFVKHEGKMAVRNTVMFAGHPIMGPRIMDGYQDLPYTIQFFKPTQAHPEGWHNIMMPMEASVELLERMVNRRSHQIDVYTGLPIVSKTQAGRVVQVDKGLFNHVQISTDESIDFPAWPGNAPDVQLHIEFLRTRVNQSGFSDVMYGGGGEAAGYAMAQQSDQNRIRLEQPIYHLELMLTSWAQKVAKLIIKFAEGTEICVYGHHKGKDYKEYVRVDEMKGYSIRSEIRAHFPAEETRNVAMASQSKGILSDYTILERYYGIEQPEDEQDRKMIDAAAMHPLVVNYAIMAELTEMAANGDEIAAQVLQAMQQGGLPGEPGRPKEDPSAVGQMGTASATGELTSQEGGGEPAGQSASDQMGQMATATPNMAGGY